VSQCSVITHSAVQFVDFCSACEATKAGQARVWFSLQTVLRHLRSARRHYLVVPRHSLSSYGRRAFTVGDPTVWNSLSDDLRDPTLSTDSFRRLLKTLFSEH